MKKLLIVFLCFSANVFASGWREWGEPQPPSKANFYISIRGGMGSLSADMKNTIPSYSTTFGAYYSDNDGSNTFTAGDTITGYGNCLNPPGTNLCNPQDISKWDEYTPNTKKLNEKTGFYGVAFGGYLPNHSNIRIELEWVRHLDFDYRDDKIYVGYQREADDPTIIQTDLDDQMEANFKSIVSSSHILFNIYYDFTNRGRVIGEWTPYIGVGLGIAQNKTTFTLIDPQGELVHDSSPLDDYFEDGLQKSEYGEISHQNFAWGATLGVNYVLSEHLSLDFGLKYSNLGQIEWGFDTSNSMLQSDELVAMDFFFGFRFDF
ncbi:MAG: outer membrane protein [Alphaproteobacteria bacterium]